MITKSRGRRGWVFHLVLRVPVWFRRYERQTVKNRPAERAKVDAS